MSHRSTLFVLLASCSSHPALAPDAAVDAAVPGNASVTVKSAVWLDDMQANAPVVVVDPDGTTRETHTDSAGHADIIVVDGSSVTAVVDGNHLATIVGVRRGDHLVFGGGTVVLPGASVDVTFTPYSDPMAVYTLETPCLSHAVSPGTTTIKLEQCSGPIDHTDIYVLATRNGVPIASAAAHDVDLTTSAITIAGAWVPAASLQIGYSNVTTGRVNVSFVDTPEAYVQNRTLDTPDYTDTLQVPTSSHTHFLFTDIVHTSAQQTVIEKVVPGATAHELDIAATLQPWISKVSYDMATRTVAATVENGGSLGADTDLIDYLLLWGADGDSGNPQKWDVYAPSLTAFALPHLPADIADPSIAVGGRPDAFVAVFATPAVSGWDDVRGRVFEIANIENPSSMIYDHMLVQYQDTLANP